MDKNEVLYEKCDVLVPAAIGNVITSENANKLNCQYVVEAANGPTTPNVSSCHSYRLMLAQHSVLQASSSRSISSLHASTIPGSSDQQNFWSLYCTQHDACWQLKMCALQQPYAAADAAI